MKPDDRYDDQGISSNERVVEESEHSKPDSLSLKKSATRKAAPHFTQLVQSEDTPKQSEHHLTPTASPKPSRSAIKSAGSRSPSPATTAGVSISRKSSFCSLFKSKEAASPDSPSGQRKKSAISILLDSPRDRSRSKSRESEKSGSGISANSTPSKQKSILAIFKPRKNSSKSSSPIDPEMHEIMSKQEHQSRKQTHNKQEEFQQRPGSTTPRLRYYDKPKDPHEGIIIPLHTPPDEKEDVTFAAAIVTSQPAIRQASPSAHVTANVDIIEPAPTPTTTTAPSSAPKPKTPVSERRPKQPITKCVVSTSTTPTASAQPKIKKTYRIELPDGSIRIPLRSPSDEKKEIDDADNNSQLWSTAVQRNSSQESQETVVSSKTPSLTSGGGAEVRSSKSSVMSAIVAQAVASATEQKSTTPPKQISQEETTVVTIENANGGIRAMSKERKRILFSTKIGSGSEEQIFATQLSLSKTESLSSQLSEQVPNLESPSNETVPRDDQKQSPPQLQHTPPQSQSQPVPQQSDVFVRMRSKEDRETDAHVGKQDVINVNRHSMYIENIDEIMETQRRLVTERKNSIAREHVIEESCDEHIKQPPTKPERMSKGQSPKSRESTEERRAGAGSSGSEHDSEMDPKVWLLI